jgi:hypothetical protein
MVNLRDIESGKVRATEGSPARRHCRSSRFPPIVKYVMQAKTTTPIADAITNLNEGARGTRSRFSG